MLNCELKHTLDIIIFVILTGDSLPISEFKPNENQAGELNLSDLLGSMDDTDFDLGLPWDLFLIF